MLPVGWKMDAPARDGPLLPRADVCGVLSSLMLCHYSCVWSFLSLSVCCHWIFTTEQGLHAEWADTRFLGIHTIWKIKVQAWNDRVITEHCLAALTCRGCAPSHLSGCSPICQWCMQSFTPPSPKTGRAFLSCWQKDGRERSARPAKWRANINTAEPALVGCAGFEFGNNGRTVHACARQMFVLGGWDHRGVMHCIPAESLCPFPLWDFPSCTCEQRWDHGVWPASPLGVLCKEMHHPPPAPPKIIGKQRQIERTKNPCACTRGVFESRTAEAAVLIDAL